MYSPAPKVLAVAQRWRPPHSSRVRTRHPMDNRRITLVARSARSRYLGVNARGRPFSRPMARSTRDAPSEAVLAYRRERSAGGCVVTDTRRPNCRTDAATMSWSRLTVTRLSHSSRTVVSRPPWRSQKRAVPFWLACLLNREDEDEAGASLGRLGPGMAVRAVTGPAGFVMAGCPAP
jgi:hypothetical protein